MSSLQAFLCRVTDEFGTEFPYRHYQTPVNKIPEELRPRQIKSSSAWGQLPEVRHNIYRSFSHFRLDSLTRLQRFRNRLQYIKRHDVQISKFETPGKDC
jgi:hypothetical protein